MVAATDVIAPAIPAGQLKHGALSLPETIGQSIANIAPTLTPALNISVVAGLAGIDSWLSYAIATVGCVFVGASIATLARRHPEAGSYFVYIGRNFGPMAGALAGWAMILAYLTTAVAVVFGFPLFLGNFLAVFHITLSFGELLGFTIAFLALVTYGAFRDIQVSSRVGLVLETISIGIIIIITAIVVFTVMAYFMVMGMDDNAGAIGGSASPFADMTNKAGLPWAAGVVYFAAMISAFACALACINASSRMLYSMGRYQFLHGSMGLVHKVHQTPYMAVLASALITLVLVLLLLPQGFLNGFGLTGTIATYGFVVVYFGVCITAPVDMYRGGLLKPQHVISGAIGALLMAFVIYSSVMPYPAYPFNYLPPAFAIFMVIGAIWFAILRARSPQILASIARDMEG